MNFLKASRIQSPLSIQALVMATTFAFASFSRGVFLFLSSEKTTYFDLLSALLMGSIFDLIVGLYLTLPFAIVAMVSKKKWSSPFFQETLFFFFFLTILFQSFFSVTESIFIEEFQSRFNFIAVDYLIYTNEIIKNAWESYPILSILPLYVLIILIISRIAFIKLIFPFDSNFSWKFRIGHFILSFGLSGVLFLLVTENDLLEGKTSISAELAKNPIHALFSAYRHNEIDYQRFYASMSRTEALSTLHTALNGSYSKNELSPFQRDQEENALVRNIVEAGKPKKLNVVIVLMESMSARFMKTFGANKELTPNLDSLATKGLSFERVYATGTRTVRGLEAILLSIPPTPGQSIIRRPNNENLFNIGTVFEKQGYKTQFLYGGNATFDNMKKFFASNGFEVLDKSHIMKDEIKFENAWGVCDESLFDFALKNADKNQTEKKPFFQLILTTSNHRPYTFPESRIDLKSRTGRDGAVKYSDYAIGRFIADAKQKDWFQDTVFIFLADHNASVAGGTKIILSDFHIPMIFYSPNNIKPEINRVLGSQIDLAPTLFRLLNFSYQSRFFGHDLRSTRQERAFLGTYQKVGLWQNNKIVLLSPNHFVEIGKLRNEKIRHLKGFHMENSQKNSDPDLRDAIGYYQSASIYFREMLLKADFKFDEKLNLRPY